MRGDNGSEFKKDFQQYCQQQGIRLIKNPPKTLEHNGKVERLHRTVEECFGISQDSIAMPIIQLVLSTLTMS